MSPRRRADIALLARIHAIHRRSRGSYGAPNIHIELREEHGIRVDEDRCRLRGLSSELIRTLTTNRNVQCNDLCDEDCVNFLEHLGLTQDCLEL